MVFTASDRHGGRCVLCLLIRSMILTHREELKQRCLLRLVGTARGAFALLSGIRLITPMHGIATRNWCLIGVDNSKTTLRGNLACTCPACCIFLGVNGVRLVNLLQVAFSASGLIASCARAKMERTLQSCGRSKTRVAVTCAKKVASSPSSSSWRKSMKASVSASVCTMAAAVIVSTSYPIGGGTSIRAYDP